jgi:hypothetical protein
MRKSGDRMARGIWPGTDVTPTHGDDWWLEDSHVPLAGFSVIEAADVNEAIQLIAGTPCARARERSKYGRS